jgi:Transposase, Mutator family
VTHLEGRVPKVARLLEEAEPDLLAFYGFPAAHRSKLRSTNPLERVNREIGRRTDVVGVFPNDAALLRLAGSLLIERNDEWLVSRRYLSEASMAEHVAEEIGRGCQQLQILRRQRGRLVGQRERGMGIGPRRPPGGLAALPQRTLRLR